MKSTRSMTLNLMRKALKGKVDQLALCKRELFYCVGGFFIQDTIYPVSHEAAAEEARFFDCPLSEE